MIDVNLLFEEANMELKHIQEFNFRVASLDERKRKICTIDPTDNPRRIGKKCRIASAWGVHHAPIWDKYVAHPSVAPETETPSVDGGGEGGGDGGGMAEQKKTIQYSRPNVDTEWKTGEAFSKLKKMDPKALAKSVDSAEAEQWSSLEDVSGYTDDVKQMDPQIVRQTLQQIKNGKIEIPVVGRWADGSYEIVSGQVKVALLVRLGFDPKVLVIDFPKSEPKKRKAPKSKPRKKTKPKKRKASTAKRTPSGEKPKSSTERVRRYYKRHPEKVRKYLKKTQDDRVKRNGDRAKAVKKHGKAKMKNHDVHHPNGPDGGSWRLAKKDHGPDKKVDEMQFMMEGVSYANILHPQEDLDLTFGDIKELAQRGIGHGVQLEDAEMPIADGQNYISFDESFLSSMSNIKAKRLAEIEKIQDVHGLNDDHTLQDYKKAWWLRELMNEAYPINDADRELLVRKWADGDATQQLMNLSSPSAISWAHKMQEQLDGNNAQAMYPIQNVIAKIGIDSVKRSIAMLSAHNPFMANIVRTKLKEAVHTIVSAKDMDKLAKVDRLIGLIDEVKLSGMPQEGLTFSHKGNLYKFTEAFAPLERIVQPLPEAPMSVEPVAEEPPQHKVIKKVLTIKEREAVKSVLTKRITNPETKNFTLVKNALKLDASHPAHRAASALIKQSLVVEHLIEGANVVGANSKIPHSLHVPMAKAAMNLIGLSKAESTIVGSTHKAVMSDLDIAVDTDGMKRIIGYGGDDNAEFFSHIRKFVDAKGYEAVYAPEFQQFTLLLPLSDAKGKPQPAYDDVGNVVSQDQGFIQVDYMLGKLDWTREYLKNGDVSNYSSIYRNVLIAVIVDAMKFDTEREDVKFKNMVNTRTGMHRLYYRENEQGEEEMVMDKFMSNDVNELAKAMFGDSAEFEQINTFEKLTEMLKDKNSPLYEIGGEIFRRFIEKLNEMNMEIPKEVPKTTGTDAQVDRTPIAVYPGNFQPYNAGHHKIYLALTKRFGKGNVYIATPGKTDGSSAPFTFGQKAELMVAMFDIPEENIIQTKDPFAPIELTKNFPNTTPVVFAMSQENADKLDDTYFKTFEEGQPLSGHAEQAYVAISPKPDMSIDGKTITGAQLRSVMGSTKVTDRAKAELFTKAYGKFNKDVFEKVVKVASKAEEEKKMTKSYQEKPAEEPRRGQEDDEATRREKAEEEEAKDRNIYAMGETWTTEMGAFGAKNSKGEIAYFSTPEAAQLYAHK